MQFVTEFLHGAPIRLQNDWGIVVGQLSFWFCVNSHKFEVLPHLLEKVVEIPFVMGRDGYTMGNFVNDIQFFDAQLVNIVEYV